MNNYILIILAMIIWYCSKRLKSQMNIIAPDIANVTSIRWIDIIFLCCLIYFIYVELL